jgi:hypothetical protein
VTATILFLSLSLTVPAVTKADDSPTSLEAKRWQMPPWFFKQAWCVHTHESVNYHISNPPYGNGFQFMLSTWVRAGGNAAWWITASPREQFYRAWRIYRQDGNSWREWSTAGACGLR